jgi:hypothetical protein
MSAAKEKKAERVVSYHRFPSIDMKKVIPTLVAADDLGRQQRSR